MTTHEEPYVPTLPSRFPSYWKASMKEQQLIRKLDPILPLLSDVTVDNEWTGFTTINISVDPSVACIRVTDEDEYLTLSMIVGCVATTSENLAVFIYHNNKGPWSYRIDDVKNDDIDDLEYDQINNVGNEAIDYMERRDQAIVTLICTLHSREVKHLETWVLTMLKEYWHTQILIEKCYENQFIRPNSTPFIA